MNVNIFSKEIELHGTASESWGMPLIEFSNNNLPVGGIIYDTIEILFKNSEYRFTWSVLPRHRIEDAIINNRADLRIYFNSEWANEKSKFVLSDPIWIDRSCIYKHKSGEQVNKISHLYSKSIIVVSGYSYPEIDDDLKSKKIKSLSAPNQVSVLKMINDKRIVYGISNEFSADYFIELNKLTNIEKTDICFKQTLIGIGVLKNNSKLLPSINKLIKRLKTSGKLEKILKKYK